MKTLLLAESGALFRPRYRNTKRRRVLWRMVGIILGLCFTAALFTFALVGALL